MNEKTKSGIGAVLEYGSVEELVRLGCSPWDRSDENVLYLIPFTMYDFIPNGTRLHDINNNVVVFEHGKTDNDYRYGMLAFGVRRATPKMKESK